MTYAAWLVNTSLHSWGGWALMPCLCQPALSTYRHTKRFPVNSSSFRHILPCPYHVATTLPPHNHENPILSTSVELLSCPINLKSYSKLQSPRFRFVFSDDNAALLGTRTPHQQSSVCREAEYKLYKWVTKRDS